MPTEQDEQGRGAERTIVIKPPRIMPVFIGNAAAWVRGASALALT